jgi:hypothetical protein
VDEPGIHALTCSTGPRRGAGRFQSSRPAAIVFQSYKVLGEVMKMRILAVISLALVAGCGTSNFQGRPQSVAAAILVTTAEIAAVNAADGKRREYSPGEWSYCEVDCRFQQNLARDRIRYDHAQRHRRNEAKRLKSEFDAFVTPARAALQTSSVVIK